MEQHSMTPKPSRRGRQVEEETDRTRRPVSGKAAGGEFVENGPSPVLKTILDWYHLERRVPTPRKPHT